MIIDPNEEHLILAVTALGRAGYKVDSATTARDGLRLARENRYDAIVIDHRLRDMAGFEVLAALNDFDRATPKVYVASSSAENIAIRAVERGATGYLLKTANFAELLPLEIEQQVARFRLRVEADRQREALRISEERYRTLFERARDPVFVVDAEGHFLALNRALSELTGYEREELLRMNLFDLLIAESDKKAGAASPFSALPDQGALEFGVRRKDGTIVDVEVTTRLVQQGPLVVGIEAIARDITAKRGAERTLLKVYARLAALYNASDDGIIVADEAGHIAEANPKVCEILGAAHGSFIGRPGSDVLRAFGERTTDAASWANLVDRAMRESGTTLSGDVEVVRPEPRILKHFTGPIRSASGAVVGRVWILADVTGERTAQRKLAESERRYRDLYGELEAIFNSSIDGIAVFAPDGTVRAVNWRLSEMLGMDAKRFVNRSASELLGAIAAMARDPSQVGTVLGKSLEDPHVVSEDDLEFVRPVHRVLQRYSGPIYDEYGRAIGRLWTVRDVTAERTAAREIRESEARYRDLFDYAGNGILLVRPDGRIGDANPAACDLFGQPREALLERPFRELVTSASGSDGSASEAGSRRYEASVATRDRGPRIVSVEDRPVVRDGQRVGREVNLVDLTEKIEVERRLVEAIGRLAAMYDATLDGIIFYDHNDRVAAVNRRYLELWDFRERDVLGRSIDEITASIRPKAKDPSGVDQTLRDTRENPDAIREYVREYERPKSRILSWYSAPVRDAQGRRMGRLWAVRDVTALQRARKALEASEANLREVVETVDEGLVRLDPEGNFLAVNPAACRIYGRREEELLGHSAFPFCAGGTEAGLRAAVETVFRDPAESHRFEATVKTPEGVVRPIEFHARVAARSGTGTSLVASMRDLTERHQFERRLVHSEQLASLGKLSAYVAHEINTPLTNISLLTASIARKTQDPEIAEKLGKITVQRRVAATIISDLLKFSRHPEPALADMDLRAAIERALEDVESYRNPSVRLRKDLGAAPLRIRGDAAQVQQVVSNVVKNAYEVTERGHVEVRAWRRSDGLAVATIEDTGPGIPPDNVSRVFEPFFTTKRLGKGTGLGLAISQNIMAAHGGQIEVESKVGEGTRFTLIFPGGEAE